MTWLKCSSRLCQLLRWIKTSHKSLFDSFGNYFDITMATASNPFAIPGSGGMTRPQMDPGSRHGSAEQTGAGDQDSYLNSMTPPTRSPRRSPRARSPAAAANMDEDDDDYQARRSERRESRWRAPSEPVGAAFRITVFPFAGMSAGETSLAASARARIRIGSGTRSS